MLDVKIRRKLPGFSLDISFSINQEILSILGPSGSGKTMSLQCIAGIVRPDEGYIALNGKVLFDSNKGLNLSTQMRKIGFIFHNYALFPHLTVDENVAYGISHLPRIEVTRKVSRLLDSMNISGLGKRFPWQLSSGQQQRVAIARALAPDPELLLLDEPFSALDTVIKERLEFDLAALQRSYKGNMLFVTHDLAQGYKLGSKMAIYNSGSIVQFDHKDKVITAPATSVAARLVGFKNLYEGFIVETNEKYSIVKIGDLEQNIKVITQNGVKLNINQKVIVGIRPENVRIVEHPGENTFPCTADQIVEGVSTTNFLLQINHGSIIKHYIECILLKSDAPLVANNQTYYAHLPPERLVIITG
jgi:molybdate transport system ATP-binding protein